MPSLGQFLSQAFNGLAFGSLLALIASGLTIILGTLGVLNFAHGAMFMLGAYTAFVVFSHINSFAAALALGALVLLLFGLAVERGLIRLYYSRPAEEQILVTFGLGIMIVEAVHYVFGGQSQRVPLPDWGRGFANLGLFFYPVEVIKTLEAGNKVNSIYGEVWYRAGDHQMVRPVPVMVGKKTNEMKGPEDYYNILELVPGDQVLPPLNETGCHLQPYQA